MGKDASWGDMWGCSWLRGQGMAREGSLQSTPVGEEEDEEGSVGGGLQ